MGSGGLTELEPTTPEEREHYRKLYGGMNIGLVKFAQRLTADIERRDKIIQGLEELNEALDSANNAHLALQPFQEEQTRRLEAELKKLKGTVQDLYKQGIGRSVIRRHGVYIDPKS